jgi:hemolysin III
MPQPIGTGEAPRNYERAEFVADGVVHAVGVALGIAGAIILLTIEFYSAHGTDIGSVVVYLACLLSMLGFSAAYNCWPAGRRKSILRRFDHAAIYWLIAATYTPFLLQIRHEAVAAALLLPVWLTAAAGTALKFFYPGRFERLSIALYLLLGWSGVLAYGAVAAALRPMTLNLIAIGGIIYSAGLIFHCWNRLRFHIAIWHCFVLGAACVHYMAVLSCVTSVI